MSKAAPGWRLRGMYAAEALLLGAPTLVFGGLLSVLAVTLGSRALVLRSIDGMVLVMLLWGLAGLTGLLCWFRLSVAFLLDGYVGLSDCARGWWLGLILGMLAALPLLGIMVKGLFETPRIGWEAGPFFAGPALLLPAAHLLWMRMRPE